MTGAGEVACAYAKRIGLTVILMSSAPQRYGERILKHCDAVEMTDTTSAAALIARAALIERDCTIAGVTTTSDFHVVQTAALAAQLGLPGNRPDAVDTIKNKFKMRDAIARIAPWLNPEYTHALTLDEAQRFASTVGFPLIAKPLTGNDSVYVKKINDFDALRAYFDVRKGWGCDVSGQDFGHGVLLEQVIGGDEFCLDLLRALGGTLIPVGAFSKKISDAGIGHFIKIGASFPAAAHETNRLVEAIMPVVDKLGFEVGAINIDCKIVEGHVKILEMNPRLVGDQMGSHMIEIATGLNPAHAIVDVACGRPLHWAPTQNRGVAIHRLTMPRSGYFAGISNAADLERHEGVETVNELGIRGQWIETAESNQGVVGSIIVSHASASEAMDLATRFAADAQILVSH